MLAPKAAEKKLDLAYQVDDAIPKILVSDVTRLRANPGEPDRQRRQIHATEGEMVIEVKAASASRGRASTPPKVATPNNGFLHFSVRDTGIGIPWTSRTGF